MIEYFIEKYNIKKVKFRNKIISKEIYGGVVLDIITDDFEIIKTMLNDIGIKDNVINSKKSVIDNKINESNNVSKNLILITDDFKLFLCGRYIKDV